MRYRGSACAGVAALAALTTVAAVLDKPDIRSAMARYMPHLTVRSISTTPIDGMLEVQIEEKGAVLYISEDGSYMVAGDLYALKEGKLLNVTERRREIRRRDMLAEVDPADTVVFAAEGEPKAVVHVFTDVDCPYCRLFHQEVPAINRYGIEIRYLAYP